MKKVGGLSLLAAVLMLAGPAGPRAAGAAGPKKAVVEKEAPSWKERALRALGKAKTAVTSVVRKVSRAVLAVLAKLRARLQQIISNFGQLLRTDCRAALKKAEEFRAIVYRRGPSFSVKADKLLRRVRARCAPPPSRRPAATPRRRPAARKTVAPDRPVKQKSQGRR